MEKVNVIIMGQDCERYLKMSLESVKDADNIIYCDGGSKDGSMKLAKKYGAIVIENEFKQKDILMNSKQKNFWLEYLKKNHKGEWTLYLDADEVIDNLNKLKELINNPPEKLSPLISIKMRHFENTLGTEDATSPEHFVPNRLFLVSKELYFPDGEHTVLWIKKDGIKVPSEGLNTYCGQWKGVTIWHLAYCPGIFDIRKRYLNHLKKSEVHTKTFIEDWYFSHLFGVYPASPIKINEIPHIILKEFLIDPDKIYFMNRRTLEVKHFVMSNQWIDYFKPKTVLDLGCGLGLFGYAIDMFGIDYQGLDESKWAIENTIFTDLNIKQGDITEKQDFKDFELVLCVDILEHLEEKDLDQTLEYIKDYGKSFLFSIPFLGDPNLDLDPTHKIKKSKEWWANKLTNKFKIKDVPEQWLCHDQLLIGEPKC